MYSTGDSNKHNGFTVSYVLIGVVLMVVLIGGIYFLKNHGEQVRRDKIIVALEKQQQSDSNNVAQKKSTDKAVNTDADIKPDSLPATGVKFDLIRLVGAFLITISVMDYLSSRRQINGL